MLNNVVISNRYSNLKSSFCNWFAHAGCFSRDRKFKTHQLKVYNFKEPATYNVMFGASQPSNGPTGLGTAGQGWGNSSGFSGLSKPNNGATSSANTGSGGLFGNSYTQPKPNLFGNSAPAGSSTLFNTGGASASNGTNPSNNSNLFSTSNGTNNGPSKQPYVPNSVFQGIPTDYEMPQSITGSLFADEHKPKPLSSLNSKQEAPINSGSIFSKVASKLNIFKNSKPYENITNQINGVFASTDFPSTRTTINPPKGTKPKNKVTKPLALSLIEARNTNETKKLIIKSKPMKFHLINADKVLNAKRKRILPSLVLSDKLLNDEPSDVSDNEINSTMEQEKLSHHSKVMRGISEEPSLSATSSHSLSRTELKPGNYWCSPSIETLSDWSLKDLSNIDNFIIGRKGYGQLAFNLPVDLSDMKRKCNENGVVLEQELFYETVEIGSKYVRVYKDNDTKPPRGFGLNVPATITLENIQPSQGKDLSAFITMLKQKDGMEFLTYDPIMFKWTFKVEHFSIWGLVDDNSSFNDEEYLKELKKQKISNETKDLPGNWGAENPSDSILTFKKKLLDNEITSQIGQVKEMPNFVAKELVKPDSPVSEDDMPIDEKPANNFEYLKQLVSVLPTNVDLLDIVQEKAYEPEIKDESTFNKIQPRPNIAISDDWLVQLKLTNDLNSSLAEYLSKPGVRIQEQGKLKYELIDDILFHNFNQSAESSKEMSTPLLKAAEGEEVPTEKIDISADNTEQIKSLKFMLHKLLEQSDFEKRSNGLFKVVKNQFKFRDFIDPANLSAKVVEVLEPSSALFDQIEINSDDSMDTDISIEGGITRSQHLEAVEQRKVFNDWIKKYNEPKVQELVANANSFQKIFIYVCTGNIKEAITTAIETNNSHLSVLLSLVDSNYQGFKNVAKSQLAEWTTNDYIPNDLIDIYKLFAGDSDQVLEPYPWSIALAHRAYFEDVKTPLYEIIDKVIQNVDTRDDITDLLSFYCRYKTEGLPKAVANLESSNMDISIKWIIYKIMGADIDDNTNLRFGKPVEQLGLWKEALYVYAHLINDVIAEKSIRKVINDHIKDIKNNNIDEEPYLVNTLRVPNSLIYESVAAEMNSAKDYWKACEAFIAAKLWEKAHDCIVHQLGPSTVISKNTTNIKRLKTIFSQFPMAGQGISTWSKGAGVFEKYLEILPYTKDLSVPQNKVEVLESLLENLPLLPVGDALASRAALCIICKDVGDLALNTAIPDVRKKIYDLPLGEAEITYFNGRIEAK